MDYAATFPNTNIIYAGGTAENILTDKRDIGRFVARIIKDERTLNQKVVGVGDSLTQNQIWDIGACQRREVAENPRKLLPP